MQSSHVHPLPRSHPYGALITLGIVAASCGSKDGNAVNAQSSKPAAYSYDHDSRINEIPATMGYSYYHDSRINEAPVDDSVNHDSQIHETTEGTSD